MQRYMWNVIFMQIYCCVGSLAICGKLSHINADQLGWWLCERQLPSGGLNGQYTFSIFQYIIRLFRTSREASGCLLLLVGTGVFKHDWENTLD